MQLRGARDGDELREARAFVIAPQRPLRKEIHGQQHAQQQR